MDEIVEGRSIMTENGMDEIVEDRSNIIENGTDKTELAAENIFCLKIHRDDKEIADEHVMKYVRFFCEETARIPEIHWTLVWAKNTLKYEVTADMKPFNARAFFTAHVSISEAALKEIHEDEQWVLTHIEITDHEDCLYFRSLGCEELC